MVWIAIEFSIRAQGDPESSGGRMETMLPPWAEFDGELAAQAVIDGYFEDVGKWGEWFWGDESGCLVVTIHSPAKIAGSYAVRMGRAVKAHAQKMTASNAT